MNTHKRKYMHTSIHAMNTYMYILAYICIRIRLDEQKVYVYVYIHMNAYTYHDIHIHENTYFLSTCLAGSDAAVSQ